MPGDGSLGYADRLSYRADLGGKLGQPEKAEQEQKVAAKALKLAELIRSSEHFVCFTGAGISTACGIPDFRGPNGVWTRQRRGQPLPKASIPFEHARPSLTHMALLALQKEGKLKYLCSQNVDSLHLRSGYPRRLMAELHGNCFAERCPQCHKEFVRDFEVCSVGFKPTGRKCDACGGALKDNCLDWDNALPVDELEQTERHAARADLALCLGTSLVIIPACDIPLLALKKGKKGSAKPDGGKLAIVNLQATQHDKRASLVVHAKVDEVMRAVMGHLGLAIPDYVRTDRLLVSHSTDARLGSSSDSSLATTTLSIQLTSVHGADCPLPWLAKCELRFAHQPVDAPPAATAEESDGGAGDAPWLLSVDVSDRAAWPPQEVYVARLTLSFAQGTTSPPQTIEYPFELGSGAKRRRGGAAEFTFETCRVRYDGVADGGGAAGSSGSSS